MNAFAFLFAEMKCSRRLHSCDLRSALKNVLAKPDFIAKVRTKMTSKQPKESGYFESCKLAFVSLALQRTEMKNHLRPQRTQRWNRSAQFCIVKPPSERERQMKPYHLLLVGIARPCLWWSHQRCSTASNEIDVGPVNKANICRSSACKGETIIQVRSCSFCAQPMR